jgi:surface antigen
MTENSFTLTLGEAGMSEVTFRHDYPYAGFPAREYDHIGGFLTRECCSYAAWVLNSAYGIEFTSMYRGARWQDAWTWEVAAEEAGLKVDDEPRRGDVAVFGRNLSNADRGHVAMVLAANDDKVWFEDYNWLPWSYEVHWVGRERGDVKYIHFEEPDETERSHARWRVELVRQACRQRAGNPA